MSEDFICRFKYQIMKKMPVFYEFLRYALGAIFVGQSLKKIISKMPTGSIIINLGSGVKKIRGDIKNIDIISSERVDIVADAHSLPFKDESVDMVIAEQLLEHVSDPQNILKEAHRVLKVGGLIYVSTPFILGYHSMPNDYYRWTLPGLKELMKNFFEEGSGMRCGPTSALVAILSEWLSSFLSFGMKYLYQVWLLIFMIVLAPLKLLDFLIYRYKTFDNIALAYYYIGRK